MWQTFFQPTYPSRVRVIGTAKIQLFFDITEMIIRMYPIDGLKGQKQIAYGNTVGHGNIRCRPERAKALVFAFALSGRLVCISFAQGDAFGYYLVAPLGRFGELRIIIS